MFFERNLAAKEHCLSKYILPSIILRTVSKSIYLTIKNKRETNNIFNRWKLMVGITQEKQFISFISIVVP